MKEPLKKRAFARVAPRAAQASAGNELSLQAQILDCIGHAVAVVDLEGRIVFWNKFSESLYGWRNKEAVGRKLLELVVPEEARPAAVKVMAKLRAGKAWAGEILTRRRDGSNFYSLMANTPLLDDRGKVVGRIAAVTDITEQKEAELILRENQTQLRALADRLTSVREAEATRIAREIHDQMGQALTALKLNAAALELDLNGRKEYDTDGKLGIRLASMSAAIESTLETALQLCTELRPVVLDKLGLIPAIEWAAHDFQTRSEIFCNLKLPAETVQIEPARATALFRILQEILTNILRHAAASEVTISLRSERNVLRLMVRDNGRGIGAAKNAAESGLGVIGMRERALGVGGRIELRDTPGGGTTVIVRIPNR